MDIATEPYLQIAKEGLLLVLICSAPPVMAALLVGFLVGVFQAATQIQEPTLSVAPKLIAVALSLIISGPWIFAQLLKFTQAVFIAVGVLSRGGS